MTYCEAVRLADQQTQDFRDQVSRRINLMAARQNHNQNENQACKMYISAVKAEQTDRSQYNGD